MKQLTNNEKISFTRREFKLPRKVAMRDSKIVGQLARAWDVEQDSKKLLTLFIKNCKLLSSQRYWEILRSVWIICGTLQTGPIFRILMGANYRNKYCFSTPEEAKELRELPDRVKVYRACNEKNDGGLSWTISKEYAQQYKTMFSKKMIVSKTIDKSRIFALVNRNNEYEVIILK